LLPYPLVLPIPDEGEHADEDGKADDYDCERWGAGIGVGIIDEGWDDEPDEDEARAPVYDWFTEGFDTRDLKEARALLDALHPDRGRSV
jgi:hypothetical protein